jgi:hypothetical protein
MFRANQNCRVQLASGKNDVHGQPIPGRFIPERCAIVKLIVINEKSSVRADSSATRGNARELEAESVILLPPTTQARIDDIIIVSGFQLRIMAMQPRYDVGGRHDHFEVNAAMWGRA